MKSRPNMAGMVHLYPYVKYQIKRSGFWYSIPYHPISSLFTLSSVLSVIGEVEEAAVGWAARRAEGQFSIPVLLAAEAGAQAAVLVVSVAVVPAVEAERAEAGKGQ